MIRSAAGAQFFWLWSVSKIILKWAADRAGTKIGSLRIRYSLEDVNDAILSRWAYVLLFVVLLTSVVLVLLAILLRVLPCKP